MRLLPGIELFSPSDSATVDAFFDHALRVKRPKYLRLDGKPLPAIHSGPEQLDFARGFSMLDAGKDVCLVTTGFATHNGRRVAETLRNDGVQIGHVDFYCLKHFDREGLARVLSGYENVFTIEESFIRRGGMDTLVADLIDEFGLPTRLKRYGPSEKYIFENGGREYLHRAYGMDETTILGDVRAVLR
jgi:transketolase